MITAVMILLVLVEIYLVYKVDTLTRALAWILTHVHVVSKSQASDPELTSIKSIFGIQEDKEV